jgi:hypothetical protein
VTRLIRRKALLIGNEHHDDPRFTPLPSTRADIWELSQVLEHRNIGSFVSVEPMVDLTVAQMQQAITEFLEGCEQDELALVYVSGHGVRLTRADGEFYFVATDTDAERVVETGVSAGFVNERLEQCWAPQKVVMIDCCESGGFAVGLRTSDRRPARAVAAKSGGEALLTSRGVYVLSSSRAGEASYADATGSADPRPSHFTAEVIEALRTGKVGTDGSGEVAVHELFHHVVQRMRAQGGHQVPVHSAHGVDDRIVIAACPLGRAPTLVPLNRAAAAGPNPLVPPVTPSPARQPTWADLLAYYQDCVLADATDTPLLSVGAHDTSYVCLTGFERLLSGEVDEDGSTSMPAEAVPLIEAAVEQDAELWAGYPAVVIHGPRGGQPWKHPRFAPLLVRRVEIVDVDGEIRLKPYGTVQPHPRLAEEWLGEEEAGQLMETYQSSWHRGQHDRMAVEARKLLSEEFELPCVQELRPDRLDDHIDVRSPGGGARNVAVLFLAPPESRYTKRLIDDFGAIAARTSDIHRTALAALSPDPSERSRSLAHTEPAPGHAVTPLACNEAQMDVMYSAMTRRITVATGPPGTGKSQLVADTVATAITAGQSVLVASSNNEAVNEVWRRCEQLVPGSVVRTGSRTRTTDYTEIEAAALHELRTGPAPQLNVATASAQLGAARDQLQHARGELARVAAAERGLRQAGHAREVHAAGLHMPVAALVRLLAATTELDRVARKASRLARARVFGRWRRSLLLRSVGLGAGGGDLIDRCHALTGFATAEARWRDAQQHATRHHDVALDTTLGSAQKNAETASRNLLASVVQTNARSGRERILGLLTARDSGRSDWPAVKEVLGRGFGAGTLPAVPGWAVTSLSVRRFPPDPALFDLVIIDEASQCAIPHVLPLLFRARRALVIGDAMQLPHIAKVGPEREAIARRKTGLRADWLERHRLAFRRHSAFHAAEHSAGGSLLLDEHFRCHPQIADVSNDLFYDSGLTVLTDVRNRPSLSRPPIVWAQVGGRARRPHRGGSWVNSDEIARVERIVQYLIEQLPADATIGVVTPFAGQKDVLVGRLRRHDEERVRVGTVHTFQGGERDVMVFSLVAGQGMSSGAISWVNRQLNLWNVAITRARSHLIVVGDADLWRQRGGIVAATLLDAAAGTAPHTGPGGTDELQQRLYQALSRQPGTAVALGEQVNGHPADALVRGADGTTTAVLLDRGPDDGADEARHLRLMLHRRRLLDGGAQGHAAVRYPAWRLHDACPDAGITARPVSSSR